MAAGHAEFTDVRSCGSDVGDAGELREWQRSLTAPDAPLYEVLAAIRATGVAVIVDPDRRLLGTLADDDLRRALLRGARLDDAVGAWMQERPATGDDPGGRAPRPIVDDRHRVVGIRTVAAPSLAERLVVVMAGGLGRRLRPLTDRCPKPMIPIGGRPLLELTLESLHGHGFRRFVFCVGYGADLIQRRFGDGRTFGVQIDYLRDRDRLGTAGPLTLLAQRPKAALLVINGDILTSADFPQLMAYHDAAGAEATMCVCEMAVQVPYGIVSVAGGRVESIHEKPVQPCRVNAGIYVLEPRVLDVLPRERSVDMPDLLGTLIRRGDHVAAFPIHERWMDIGSPTDLADARAAIGGSALVTTGGRASRQARAHSRQTVQAVFDDR